MYKHGNNYAGSGRLGADPVNNSISALYDEEDVGMMDSSYEGVIRDCRRKDLKSSRPTRSSDFASHRGQQYPQEKMPYNTILGLESDNESEADRYFTKDFGYSKTLKSSPKRKKDDGSFPKLY